MGNAGTEQDRTGGPAGGGVAAVDIGRPAPLDRVGHLDIAVIPYTLGDGVPRQVPVCVHQRKADTRVDAGRCALERYSRIEPVDPGGHGECDGFVVVGDPLPVGDMRASGVRQLDDRCLDRLVVRERPGGYADVLRGPGYCS